MQHNIILVVKETGKLRFIKMLIVPKLNPTIMTRSIGDGQYTKQVEKNFMTSCETGNQR